MPNVLTRIEEKPAAHEVLGIEQEALLGAARQGLPYAAYERVQGLLSVPSKELARAVRISPRTLRRRKEEGHLSPEESDRLIRLARIVALALWVYESPDKAARWLTSEKQLLAGETPLERTDSEPGAREVEDMLYAIEFTFPA